MTCGWNIRRLVFYTALLKCGFRDFADRYLQHYHLDPPSSLFERLIMLFAEVLVDRLSRLINQLILFLRFVRERSEAERPGQSTAVSPDNESPLCVRGFIVVFMFVLLGDHLPPVVAAISSIPSVFDPICRILSMFAAISSFFVSLRLLMLLVATFILVYATVV